MTMTVRVRPEDPTPPYEQLRAQIAAAIATGELATGERLPPVRQLARDLGLAAGTVARTYRILESAGLVTTARGAGTTVAGSSSPTPAQQLAAITASYIEQARRLGASDDAIQAEVRSRLR